MQKTTKMWKCGSEMSKSLICNHRYLTGEVRARVTMSATDEGSAHDIKRYALSAIEQKFGLW